MNWKDILKFTVLIGAIVSGVSTQLYLVQTGHWDFVKGYIAGVIVYQFLSDPQWLREITEPDEFVSVLMWVLFPFAATLGMMWRIIFLENERR